MPFHKMTQHYLREGDESQKTNHIRINGCKFGPGLSSLVVEVIVLGGQKCAIKGGQDLSARL